MSDQTQNELQKALSGVRADIDRIDGELLRLLNERARCAQKVGEIKAEHGEAGHIYRPEREAQVLRRLQEANPGPLPGENITFFFREVMSACLALEEPLGIAFLKAPSTMCSARSSPVMPTTRSYPSRIQPKARSAARWTCCCPPP